jgi:Bacterial Ig-like domain
MTRFTRGVAVYVSVCLILILGIVIRGDGPHPAVTGVYPPNGDRYWPGGAAQITFSQAMDESSVERALQVTPGTQGQGAWYGTTLNLQPIGDWKDNVTYHVKLVGKVTDDLGRPLRTPISYWFHVRHVAHLTLCRYRAVDNVCERFGKVLHPLTHSSALVLQYALSSDGSQLAYIHRDGSGLPHLFIVNTDGTGSRQLTQGRTYADSHAFWSGDDTTSISYYRRPVTWIAGHARLGRPQLWNVLTDGSENARV